VSNLESIKHTGIIIISKKFAKKYGLPDETEEERDRGITMDVGQNKVRSQP
jgi:translation elongation factor EF-1alpha